MDAPVIKFAVQVEIESSVFSLYYLEDSSLQ